MKKKLNPFWVGSFVFGAVVLIVAALLSFRSLHVFSRPGRFQSYFNESVQGLDVGSAVKLHGVRVGRVLAIRVLYNPQSLGSQVVIVGELNRDIISDSTGSVIRITDRGTLQRLVKEGLRAKIDLVGITGAQFVELDFMDPVQFPASPAGAESEYPKIPTLRSGMSELIANLSRAAGNLNKVDFAGLAKELQSLLSTVNHQVGEVDLGKMVAQVTGAANSVANLASSDEAKKAFLNLNKTASEVQGLVANINNQVEPIRAELIPMLHSFHEAADGVREVVGPRSGLSEEILRTLQQVSDAADSMQRLADFLERNPNALIIGRKRPEKTP